MERRLFSAGARASDVHLSRWDHLFSFFKLKDDSFCPRHPCQVKAPFRKLLARLITESRYQSFGINQLSDMECPQKISLRDAWLRNCVQPTFRITRFGRRILLLEIQLRFHKYCTLFSSGERSGLSPSVPERQLPFPLTTDDNPSTRSGQQPMSGLHQLVRQYSHLLWGSGFCGISLLDISQERADVHSQGGSKRVGGVFEMLCSISLSERIYPICLISDQIDRKKDVDQRLDQPETKQSIAKPLLLFSPAPPSYSLPACLPLFTLAAARRAAITLPPPLLS